MEIKIINNENDILILRIENNIIEPIYFNNVNLLLVQGSYMLSEIYFQINKKFESILKDMDLIF